MLDMKNEKFKDSTCPENVKEFISIYLFHLSTLDINKIQAIRQYNSSITKNSNRNIILPI